MIISSAKDLALYLNDQRKQLKMTQSEVADLVGLKQDTISKFENSPDNSRVDTLFRTGVWTNSDLYEPVGVGVSEPAREPIR